jgi:hypothetical protein
MPVETRAYMAGDERQILDLFARSFPHAPRGIEHFRWKYRENPFGNERISLTFVDDQLAGHYAGYVVPFRAYGKDILAHQIGDTMTDVGVRHIGRGPTSILGRTALDFYARFCEGQIAFNYGFNAGNIQKISLRFLRSDRGMGRVLRARRERVPLPRPPRCAIRALALSRLSRRRLRRRRDPQVAASRRLDRVPDPRSSLPVG